MEKETRIDETIAKISFLFRCAGLKIGYDKQSLMDYIKLRLIFVNQLIWLNTDLWGAIYWFIDGLTSGKDFLELTYIAPCIFLTSMASLKVIIMMRNEKYILRLLNKMRELEYKDKRRLVSEEKTKIINEEQTFLHICLKVVNITFSICLVAFALSPIVIMMGKYFQTKKIELLFPFMIKYPFDSFNPRVYPFVYMHQMWSEVIDMFFLCSADYFFFTCCTYIRIQFKLLNHHIKNELLRDRSFGMLRADEQFYADFKDLVIWHQELYECINMVEDIFTNSILLNFMTSSLVICLTGFNVTTITDIYFVITFLSLLTLGLIQIFLLCIFAELLRTSSLEISDAVYNSRWYAVDARIAKCLLTIQIRAQQPIKITASGFAYVNLNSFMRVLSSAWSYFALLQTIYSN